MEFSWISTHRSEKKRLHLGDMAILACLDVHGHILLIEITPVDLDTAKTDIIICQKC